MRLALRVGRLDVDQMLAELSPEQLLEWRAALDVVGLDDAWQQAGMVASTTYNTLTQIAAGLGGGRKRHKWVSPMEFVPLLRRKRRPTPAVQDRAAMFAVLGIR